MYKQYFKQAWNLIRQERLFSLIYMIGTGLSVSMVMVLSIVFYMKLANIYPETNRDRMLIARSGMISYKGSERSSSSMLSEETIKTCFGTLEGVEAIGLEYGWNIISQVQQVGNPEQIPVTARFVNTGFWTVFSFRFLEGKPFTDADQQSGIQTAVIAESLARRLFGTVDAVGKYVSLDFRQYRVCGIVKDASPVTQRSYALLWIPYTAHPKYTKNSDDDFGVLGSFKSYILASKGTDLAKLKAEAKEHIRRFDQTLEQVDFTMLGQPDYHWQSIFRFWSSHAPDFGKLMLQYGLIFLLLLLVPAVSLSGMADSRMERRLSEMGVRRAFGAPIDSLMKQIITENLLFTLLGGLFGLLLSYLLLYVTRNWIMQVGASYVTLLPEGADTAFSLSMLLNYQVFFIALAVCFLLNLLSALIPAWRASHREIIYSLNAK